MYRYTGDKETVHLPLSRSGILITREAEDFGVEFRREAEDCGVGGKSAERRSQREPVDSRKMRKIQLDTKQIVPRHIEVTEYTRDALRRSDETKTLCRARGERTRRVNDACFAPAAPAPRR